MPLRSKLLSVKIPVTAMLLQSSMIRPSEHFNPETSVLIAQYFRGFRAVATTFRKTEETNTSESPASFGYCLCGLSAVAIEHHTNE